MKLFLNRHIDTAERFMAEYDGITPFHLYLKTCLKQEKKYGSKDRKNISRICYTVFRTGKSLNRLGFKEQFTIAHFLLQDSPDIWAFLYTDNWLLKWTTNQQNRIRFVKEQLEWFDLNAVFSFGPLSNLLVDQDIFVLSHFMQPNVFIRVRPGHQSAVSDMITGKKMFQDEITETCIALTPPVDLTDADGLNKTFVVQDYASQQTGTLLSRISAIYAKKPTIKVWDCCAASGGKSIMAYDLLQSIDLTVSDIRVNILHNLKTRFQQAGIQGYKSLVIDLSKKLNQAKLPHPQYDLIICDVPCTGSGTWSRTPEQLQFFDPGSIVKYTKLQQSIVSNVLPFLAPQGYLLYITCSVFKQENEDLITSFAARHNLSIIEMNCIPGAAYHADTMFACLLEQNK